MKISKHGIHYFVHAYEGNIIGKLFRALFNFKQTFYIDNVWNLIQNGKYEEETYYIFDYFLDQKHSVIDIGAWRGAMTLYACQLARHCYTIEPDPVSFLMLKANIDLNPSIKNKVTPYNIALLDHSGETIVSARFSFDQTLTSTSSTYSGSQIRLPSLTFPDFINKYEITDCNFIKMDTEGAEVLILPKMRQYLKRYKPTFYLAFHPNHFNNLERDVQTIINTAQLYRYIYDPRGNELSLDLIRKKLDKITKFDILLTNHRWNKRAFGKIIA